MASKLMNEGPKFAFLFLWFGAQIIVFFVYFFKFYNGIEYYYLIKMTGLALPFARASAGVLNLNCMLLLLPVCRNLISFVRRSATCCRRNVRRQLDKNIIFHKNCAYAIVAWTAVHYYAHCFNFKGFLDAHNSPNNATAGLLSALTQLSDPWLNPVRTSSTNPMLELIKVISGWSGVLITLSLILIVSSSTMFIRRSYYEVFWFTHHLFVIFYACLVIHGIGGLVRSQNNTAAHDPLRCEKLYRQWGQPSAPECPVPTFAAGQAQTWMWVIGPMVIYVIERVIRFIRSFQKVEVIEVVEHPSRVMEFRLRMRGFSMEAGQYVFIQCPRISQLEWHPFTLTSAPGDDYFSVHVRTAGDWTSELGRLCGLKDGQPQRAQDLPRLSVDGPFGTASEDIYRYQVDILVGAGIGVTPFASILKDIWHRQNQGAADMKLRKVYFYWICPDTQAFEWFSDLLKDLERQMRAAGKPDMLDYNIYLTRGWDKEMAADIVSREGEVYDVVTGLRQKTHYGRPNWEQIFSRAEQDHPGVSVGVFLCGPKALSTTLHRMCNQHSSSDPRGCQFFYNKENF